LVEAHHKKLRGPPTDAHTQVVGSVQNIKACVPEVVISNTNDFWVDPASSRPVFSVEVFGDFSEVLFEWGSPPPRRRGSPPPPSDPQILARILEEKVRLWSRDFVIVKISDFYAVFLNRGLSYRLWRDSLRVRAVSKYIAKHHRRSRDSTNVVFLTLTYDPNRFSVTEAWKDVGGRISRVLKWFKRHYGLKVGLAVLETHDNLYPHVHMVLLLEREVEVFEHRGLLRLREKKTRWERALAREGFVDAQAPRSAREISRYLSKYLNKVSRELPKLAGGDYSPKALTPFLARLYRVPLVRVYPKGFDKRLLGLTKGERPKPPPEEVLLAEAIWSAIYRRPVEGIPFNTLDYWHKVNAIIRERYAQWIKARVGREPEKRAYDLINISRIQSPPDWAFWSFVMSLLCSYHEARSVTAILGYCGVSAGA
jgi:hypothetical protein